MQFDRCNRFILFTTITNNPLYFENYIMKTNENILMYFNACDCYRIRYISKLIDEQIIVNILFTQMIFF